MSSNRVTLCCALFLAACSRPSAPTKDATPSANSVVIPAATEPAPSETNTTPAPAANSAAATGDDCERLFAEPANADKLCDEHDNAVDSELHWQSYATKESRVDVNRRYHEWASRCHFGFVTKPPIFSVTKGPTRLSTHEASISGYPTCEKKPSADHQTVIVISTMLKR
jgi:hypothetical protein